jgi:hypothetical protein
VSSDASSTFVIWSWVLLANQVLIAAAAASGAPKSIVASGAPNGPASSSA